jgi:hypothetical protein
MLWGRDPEAGPEGGAVVVMWQQCDRDADTDLPVDGISQVAAGWSAWRAILAV